MAETEESKQRASQTTPSDARQQVHMGEACNGEEMNLRLLRRARKKEYVDRNLTFSPKLSKASIRLARRRSENLEAYHNRRRASIEAMHLRFEQECTFKPAVSDKSVLIVEKLGSSFHLRQQKHLEKIQQLQEDASKVSPTFKPTINKTRGSPTKNWPIGRIRSRVGHTPCDLPSRCKSVAGPCPGEPGLPEVPQVANVTGKSLRIQSLPQRPCSGSVCVPPSHHYHHQAKEAPAQVVAPVRDTPTWHVRVHSMPVASVESKSLHDIPKQRSQTVGLPTKLKPFAANCSSHIRLKKIKAKADEIVRAKKVFVVRGPYKAVRRGLRQRGWIERDYNKVVSCNPDSSLQEPEDRDDSGPDLPDESSDEEYSDEEDYCLLSRAVRNSLPHLIWTIKREQDLYTCLRKDQLVNHIKGSGAFTTKIGLCSNLQEALWLGDVDCQTFFPRCYKLSCDEEKEYFVEDFRLTAAMSLLRIATEPGLHFKGKGPEMSKGVLNLALRACQVHLNSLEHGDIEGSSTWLAKPLLEPEWSKIMLNYSDLLRSNGCFDESEELLCSCKQVLESMQAYSPQMAIDGVHNVWIVKPGALSRGRGIMCMNKLSDILDLVSSPTQKKEGRWIVQKYIERPLLVHGTKFDIRQWFLVSEWNPLTMWMYKDSYLRFSSRLYSLRDMDRSIHLCNNSVQCTVGGISEGRSDQLPADNMWYHTQFISHLSQCGQDGAEVWSTVVYPGMCQAIINVLRASLDVVEQQAGHAFELFGADFMLSDDYTPWLIEVNSSPSMAYSTQVTKNLCRKVQEDGLKVMVDRAENKDCSTGEFELTYKHPKVDTSVSMGIKMTIEGSAIPKPTAKSKQKQ